MSGGPAQPASEVQRLDKWLWAARFFKTRGLAQEAISGGKVHVDGQRVKPSKVLRPGDEVRVRKGSFEITVLVRGLCAQRRPAAEAADLYQETEPSRRQREDKAEQRRAEGAPARPRGTGRPTKRERRDLGRLRGR